MYTPKPFVVTDKKTQFDFIEQNSFGHLLSIQEEKITSTAMPFLLSKDKNYLFAHFARANPQWKSLEGQQVTILIQGEHEYVSPSWYKNAGVPTWNYQVMKIYGKVELIHANDEVKHIVDSLTKKYEKNLDNPWKIDYDKKMLNMIVGIQISIDEIECKFKLSQNKTREDQLNIIYNLQKKKLSKMATIMDENLSL